MSKEERLFEQFPPVSTEEWMEKVKADLKGADFTRKLVWKTNEGFDVMPFYRSENLEGLGHVGSLPGEYPFVRATREGNPWLVRQNISVSDYGSANAFARDILTRGVDSLGFVIADAESVTEKNMETLLKGIHPDCIETNFSSEGRAMEVLQYFLKAVRASGFDPAGIRGAVEADPLGRLMLKGSLCVSIEEGLDYLASLFRESEALPRMRVLQINAAGFSNAGADIVRELAFALSMGNEYLSQLTERGIPVDNVAAKTGFTFAIGSNYFMEIAKLRAARLLWALIVKAYKPLSEGSCRMNILSVTSEWNKTIYDPYVNMLRSQTEAMSATLGGTDALVVNPFDSVFAEPGEFSMRIARNQQLLLKEEAHFDKVADPGAGSYYIETLTAMVAESAWKLFVGTEERGGFIKALKDGFIQAEVEKVAGKRIADISKRKEVLVGTNQYPDLREKAGGRIDKLRAFRGKEPSKDVVVRPLRLIRGAEEFEKLRLATERSSKEPVVFILPAGHPAMRMARAQFSVNFFGCAGYKVIDNAGYSSVEDGVRQALAAKADIIVLCSSDEEYAALAPQAFSLTGGRAVLVIAGNPECADELRGKGIGHFISIRSDVLETLREYNTMLGIEI